MVSGRNDCGSRPCTFNEWQEAALVECSGTDLHQSGSVLLGFCGRHELRMRIFSSSVPPSRFGDRDASRKPSGSTARSFLTALVMMESRLPEWLAEVAERARWKPATLLPEFLSCCFLQALRPVIIS
jgi:hypothetical protein